MVMVTLAVAHLADAVAVRVLEDVVIILGTRVEGAVGGQERQRLPNRLDELEAMPALAAGDILLG